MRHPTQLVFSGFELYIGQDQKGSRRDQVILSVVVKGAEDPHFLGMWCGAGPSPAWWASGTLALSDQDAVPAVPLCLTAFLTRCPSGLPAHQHPSLLLSSPSAPAAAP